MNEEVKAMQSHSEEFDGFTITCNKCDTHSPNYRIANEFPRTKKGEDSDK